MTNLINYYQLDKSNLTSSPTSQNPPLQLVIGTRRKPEASKPPNFLLQKLSGGKFAYISSLYPSKNATSSQSITCFEFDYKGELYLLKIDREKSAAEIMPCKGVAAANL